MKGKNKKLIPFVFAGVVVGQVKLTIKVLGVIH
jgi:hypothetical protein